jgi:hypothetical protein
MPDRESREAGDVERARSLGESLAAQLYEQRVPATEIFVTMLGKMGVSPTTRHSRDGRWFAFIGQMGHIEFVEDLVRVRRLIDYSRALDLGGMLVFRKAENVFGEPPLLDFLNPRTRRAFLKGRASRELTVSVRELTEQGGVEIRDYRAASTGFMILFTDSVQANVRAAGSTGTTHVNYTVNSQNKGYQLEYYPQYNYSPVVFGTTLTYPVTDYIKTGHHYFQAWHHNTLYTDSRARFAGTNNTSTTIQAF